MVRNIINCETAALMWKKLERLYMSNIPDRVYLQVSLYNFKMNDSRSIHESIDDFLKLVADLSNLSVLISDEAHAICC